MGVLGIGGLFFRAVDPEALSQWYREHLNVGAGCVAKAGETPDKWSWSTEAGPVVFAPFTRDTDYFSSEKQFMLNLRVANLAQLVEELESNGVKVTSKDEWNDPNVGNFARIHDPEGNPIELWEPPSAEH